MSDKIKEMPVDLTAREKQAWANLENLKKSGKKLKTYSPQEYEDYLVIERYKAKKRKAQAEARLTAISAKKRKAETRAKILIGSVFLAWIKIQAVISSRLLDTLGNAKKSGVKVDERDWQAMVTAIEAARNEGIEATKIAAAKSEKEKAANNNGLPENSPAEREGGKTAVKNTSMAQSSISPKKQPGQAEKTRPMPQNPSNTANQAGQVKAIIKAVNYQPSSSNQKTSFPITEQGTMKNSGAERVNEMIIEEEGDNWEK